MRLSPCQAPTALGPLQALTGSLWGPENPRYKWQGRPPASANELPGPAAVHGPGHGTTHGRVTRPSGGTRPTRAVPCTHGHPRAARPCPAPMPAAFVTFPECVTHTFLGKKKRERKERGREGEESAPFSLAAFGGPPGRAECSPHLGPQGKAELPPWGAAIASSCPHPLASLTSDHLMPLRTSLVHKHPGLVCYA